MTSPAYLKLAEAIKEAPIIPPCMNTDPEIWFPESGARSIYVGRIARELCGKCPVQQECLTYALEEDIRFGIWGGLTAENRLRLQGRGRNR